MPSALYRRIWEAVHARQLITFTYDGLPRKGCAVILGYGKGGEEGVFVYQTGGRTSGNEKLPSWKCLRLDKIKSLALKGGLWSEGASHRQAQTCIIKVDVDVNIPETLTRKSPLEFYSPDLLPPREKP